MIKCMLMLTNSGHFYSILISLTSYHPTEIHATAGYSVWMRVSSEYIRCSCGSVVEHCVSSTTCCGFNSQGIQILIKIKCVSWMHCNLLWIKVFDIYIKLFIIPHSQNVWTPLVYYILVASPACVKWSAGSVSSFLNGKKQLFSVIYRAYRADIETGSFSGLQFQWNLSGRRDIYACYYSCYSKNPLQHL